MPKKYIWGKGDAIMSNKVLLLLADGMRPDFVLNCGNAFAQMFLKESVYTMDGRAVMPSVTLPCHMSLFHGVTPERHGILTNTYVPQVRPVRGLCEVLREAGKRNGFYYDWEELKDLYRPGNVSDAVFMQGDAYSYENSMVRMTKIVVERLKENFLDFMFVYFGLPDHAGHKYGFTSEEYREAVKSVWDNIKSIKESLPGDCGMIVTADHGGSGRGHGTDSADDMTIPIIFNGDMFKNIDRTKIKAANITDIAPTITEVMAVSSDSEWEGQSLLGALGKDCAADQNCNNSL